VGRWREVASLRLILSARPKGVQSKDATTADLYSGAVVRVVLSWCGHGARHHPLL